MMDEQKFLRLLATTLAVGASIGLAVSLGVHVNVWLGWLALVICWLPTSWHLWAAERSRREMIVNTTPMTTERWRSVDEDERV